MQRLITVKAVQPPSKGGYMLDYELGEEETLDKAGADQTSPAEHNVLTSTHNSKPILTRARREAISVLKALFLATDE